jgi:hypothetical protein
LRRPQQLALWSIAGLVLPLQTELHVFAQQKSGPATKASVVLVPFVGCKADGQLGPVDAPKGSPVNVRLDAKTAKELAYYSGVGLGVLGPRGWNCFGGYGSSGETLFVSAQPIEITNVFPDGTTGPAIEVSHRNGGTGSGAFELAEVVARVFPDFEAFAKNVAEQFGPIPFGPYPNDKLIYRGKREVEYKTPAQTEGLGTRGWLKTSDSQIEGVAILIGQPLSHLLLLSMRLPPDSRELSSAIIRQIERDSPKVMH